MGDDGILADLYYADRHPDVPSDCVVTMEVLEDENKAV